MKKRFFTLLCALFIFLATIHAQENMINGHEYVDLGLPSGTLWATCNVGANSPEEYGDYFAWGETKPKEEYSWETYKWGIWIHNGWWVSKYCDWATDDLAEFYDGKNTLDLEDDAAYVNWGGRWHMPTTEQQVELANENYCRWEFDSPNGVNGWRVTSKRYGNSIFLPASGFYHDKGSDHVGVVGHFWSNHGSVYAGITSTQMYGFEGASGDRSWGLCVRPVAEQAYILLNAENFPDAAFRNSLAQQLKISENGKITEKMIANVKTLVFGGCQIKSLTGIEHFTALTELRCNDNYELTSIDVSKNTLLEYLECNDCQLTSLNVSGCTKLKYLNCSNNQLASLDVSENSALQKLICDDCQLQSLVSKSSKLKYISCKNNQLSSLNVSPNTELDTLYCTNNQLSTLDLTKNINLSKLFCGNNQLTSLEVSNNINLNALYCNNNQLSTLDVSKNTALTTLYCNKNQLTTLDVSKNTALTSLYCNNNKLASLDVSKNTMLTWLYCEYNQITSLNVNNTTLRGLSCYCNQIKGAAMDAVISNLPVVCYDDEGVYTWLRDKARFYVIDSTNDAEGNICTRRQVRKARDEHGWTVYDYKGGKPKDYTGLITGITLNKESFPDANLRTRLANIFKTSEGKLITEEDIAAMTNLQLGYSEIANLAGIEVFTSLKTLDCSNNHLESIDISKFSDLEYLYCGVNQLASVDVSKNTSLKELYCYKNQLTALDVSQNSALKQLDCYNNQLTSLDVSENAALESLDCHSNQLGMLDVSQNALLTYLSCYDNQLSSLNVSNNTLLTSLSCSENQLASIDVSKNTELNWLNCNYNQLTSIDVSNMALLKTLDCQSNPISTLNASGCTALNNLYFDSQDLVSLNVSGCTALTELSCNYGLLNSLNISDCTALMSLYCEGNQLSTLDVGGCVSLATLVCSSNQLSSIDISNNPALEYVDCHSNHIEKEAMGQLVGKLPMTSGGIFIAIDTKDQNEGNSCSKSQVTVAKEKGWTVYDFNDGNIEYDEEKDEWFYPEYEGSDEDALILNDENFGDTNFREALSEILNVNEGDDIAEEVIEALTMLDVSDKSIADLSGIEYFTALTTLYCQINQISDKAMTSLIGALPDLSGNEAKGLKLTEETNPRKGALYALDFTDENEQNVCTAEHVAAANAKGWTVYCKTSGGWQEYNGEIPTGINTVDSGELTDDSWYTIDGKKLAGEPKEKGIYIRNGRKVVK